MNMQEAKKQKLMREAMACIGQINKLIDRIDSNVKARRKKAA